MDEIAVRYAGSLLSIAKSENALEHYKQAMQDLWAKCEENPELPELLMNAFLSKTERRAIIDRLISNPEAPSFASFIKLLLDNNRLPSLRHIAGEFILLANIEMGIEEGTVYSTYPLDAKVIDEIATSLAHKRGTKLTLTNKVDETLLGGIKIVVPGNIYDGSVSNQIDALTRQLLKGQR